MEQVERPSHSLGKQKVVKFRDDITQAPDIREFYQFVYNYSLRNEAEQLLKLILSHKKGRARNKKNKAKH